MTIDEIILSAETTLPVYKIAKVVGLASERITAQAIEDASKLGFPVIVVFDTVRVPRVPFLRFLGCEV